MEKTLCKWNVKFRENGFNILHRGLKKASLISVVRNRPYIDYLGEENSGQETVPREGSVLCKVREWLREQWAGAGCTGAEEREMMP